MEILEVLVLCIAGLIIIAMIIAMIGSVKHDREISYKWDKLFREENRDD